MRGKPGRTERVIGAGVLVLLVLIVGAFLLTGGLFAGIVNRTPILRGVKDVIGISEQPLFEVTYTTAAPTGEARFAEVPRGHVRPPARVRSYTDDLYEKIDGKESMFRSYFFVELRFGQYEDTRGDDLYDVYIFDMGAPANALGIYMAERSRSPGLVEIGREGYMSAANTYFWKSRYYVNVLGPAEGGEAATGTSKQIAAAIADTIPDSGEPFWVESYLPPEDRVPHSLSYQATSALGYEFLGGMFLADYETQGKPYQMYLIKAVDADAARELFEKFAQATAKYDKVISRQAFDGGEMLVGESLGIYSVAFCKGVFFGGVIECEYQALAVKRAVVLRDRLPAGESGDVSPSVSPVVKPEPDSRTQKASREQDQDGADEY